MHILRARYYTAWLVIALWLAGMLISKGAPELASAQAAATDTAPSGGGQAYITNIFEEAINVRTGPHTVTYPICGQLPVGANAMALGTTPLHEWVQIEFPECPGGVGWVYAENVTLTGTLREVEPPSTPVPLATSTLDPTLAAAFQSEPTATRLPTFTPPPPLVRPTFTETAIQRRNFPTGAAILAAALIGGLVLAVSFIGRR